MRKYYCTEEKISRYSYAVPYQDVTCEIKNMMTEDLAQISLIGAYFHSTSW